MRVTDRGKARRRVQWWSLMATEQNRGLRLPWHVGRSLDGTTLDGRDPWGRSIAELLAPDQKRPLSIPCNGQVLAANVARMSDGQEEALLPIRCNLQSCPVCGEIGGFAHSQRASRVFSAIGGARSGWHVVLTVGSGQRDRTDPALVGLDKALSGLRSLLDCAARWVKKWWAPSVRICTGREWLLVKGSDGVLEERQVLAGSSVATGYFFRAALHWSGDEGHGWEPHVHVLVGHDAPGMMPRMAKDEFNTWRDEACAYWSNQVRHAIGGGRITVLHAEPVDGSRVVQRGRKRFRIVEGDAAKLEESRRRQWLHRVYYMTRPTWRLGWWASDRLPMPEQIAKLRPEEIDAATWRRACYDLYAAVSYGSVFSRWSRAKCRHQAPDVVGLFDQVEHDDGAKERAQLVQAMGRLSRGLSPVTDATIVEWQIKGADYWQEATRNVADATGEEPATVDLGGFLWRPPGWWDTPSRQAYREKLREISTDDHGEAWEPTGPPPRTVEELLKDARADLLCWELVHNATRRSTIPTRIER